MLLTSLLDLELPPKYAPVMSVACRTNAALMQWTTAIQSVTMAALAVERAVTLRQADAPKADPSNRLTHLLPALMWLYGTVLVAPIITTSHTVGVRLFPNRLVRCCQSEGVCTRVRSRKESFESELFLSGKPMPFQINSMKQTSA